MIKTVKTAFGFLNLAFSIGIIIYIMLTRQSFFHFCMEQFILMFPQIMNYICCSIISWYKAKSLEKYRGIILRVICVLLSIAVIILFVSIVPGLFLGQSGVANNLLYNNSHIVYDVTLNIPIIGIVPFSYISFYNIIVFIFMNLYAIISLDVVEINK